jgi:hypothetical protein
MAVGRKTGGRQRGTPNKRTAEVLAAADRAIASLRAPFEGDGVALLQIIYKDHAQPLNVRMSAAAMAAKFERPTMVMTKDIPPPMSSEKRDARIRELLSRANLSAPTIDLEVDDDA